MRRHRLPGGTAGNCRGGRRHRGRPRRVDRAARVAGAGMTFTDLLRLTVFLAGAEASALGAVTALSASQKDDTTTLLVAGGWWLAAAAIGLYLGRREAAADALRDALSAARTSVSLPADTPARTAAGRLWP